MILNNFIMYQTIRCNYFVVLSLFTVVILISCANDDDNTSTPIFGCTDPNAVNYNSNATEDDGSCNFTPFTGALDWIKTFGGSNEDNAVAIEKTDDGGFIVLGTTRSSDGDITGKSTNDVDFWLLKISTNGEKVWDKTFGGSSDDLATDMKKTNNGTFIITGYTGSNDGDVSENAGQWDYWILEVDGSGNLLWEKTWGYEGNDRGFGIIQTNDGGYFVTGELDVGFIEGDEGNDLNETPVNRESQHSLGDYWGIKMDADGNKIWRRYFGGSNVDESLDVIETLDGGFLLIGISESTDFDISNARGANDFWVVKIDENGNLQWEKSYGGSESDFAYSITNTQDGNYIITGDTRSSDFDISSFKGNADVWIVKFNSVNGNIIWEKTFGGTNFESSRNILNLSNGNYLISGNSSSNDMDTSSNNGANDAWVFMINDNGGIQFEKSIGGSNIDFAVDAVENTANEIIIVGYSNSSDNDIPENKGGNDLLIYKLK